MAKQGCSFTTKSSSQSNCCLSPATPSAGSLPVRLKSCAPALPSLQPSAQLLHPSINLPTPSQTPLWPPHHLECHPSFPLFSLISYSSPAIESHPFIFGFFLTSFSLSALYYLGIATISNWLCLVEVFSSRVTKHFRMTEFRRKGCFTFASNLMGNSRSRLRILLLFFYQHPYFGMTSYVVMTVFLFAITLSHLSVPLRLLKSVASLLPWFPSRWLWVCWQLAKGPSVSSHPSQENQSSHPGSIRWLATAFHGKSLYNDQSLCYTEQKQHSQLKHRGEQIALSPFIWVQSNSWHSPGGKALVQMRNNVHFVTEAATRWSVRLVSQGPVLVCVLQRFNYGVLLLSLLYSCSKTRWLYSVAVVLI